MKQQISTINKGLIYSIDVSKIQTKSKKEKYYVDGRLSRFVIFSFISIIIIVISVIVL